MDVLWSTHQRKTVAGASRRSLRRQLRMTWLCVSVLCISLSAVLLTVHGATRCSVGCICDSVFFRFILRAKLRGVFKPIISLLNSGVSTTEGFQRPAARLLFLVD